MPQGKQSRGQCAFCGHTLAKGSINRHLASCEQRKAQVVGVAQSNPKPETLYHLRVQDAASSDFWLDLEVRGSAKLSDIDFYLRGIWLECCGHLSQFSIGGWRGNEIATSRKVDAVFKPGVEVTHIYDFGTSSETLIKTMGQHNAVPLTPKPLVLMARNLMPEAVCTKCDQPATHFCMECMVEDNTSGMLCPTHVANHPHDDYGEPMALLNSPRLGMCGYDGPAEPPY